MSSSPYSGDNVRRGVIHYLFGRGVAGLAGFATVLLLVRYMDVQGYAGYTALSGLAMMCGVISTLGLERAIARYVPEGQMHHGADELLSFIWKTALIRLLASLSISLLIFVFWGPLTQVIDYIRLDDFPPSLALFIVAETLFQHFSSVFQALMLQKMLTRLLVIQWCGRLLLIVAALMADAMITLEDVLWIVAIPEIIGVVAFVCVLNYQRVRLVAGSGDDLSSEEAAWPSWGPVMTMAMHNYGFNLLAAPPQGYFMRMLIAVTLPVEVVAAYGFFQSIAEKARQYIPMHFFFNMIEPLMMAQYLKEGDFAALSHRCQVLYKSNLLLFIPAIAWVAAAGPYIATAMTGGKFDGQSWILLVVMLQLLIGSHVLVLQLILNALGRSSLLVRASSYALVGFVGFVLIASQVAELGLLFAPLIFSLILNVLIVRALNREGYPYQPAWKMLREVIAVGSVVGLVVALSLDAIHPAVSHLLVAAVSGVVVFSACGLGVYASKIIDREDINLIRNMFNKKTESLS